MPICPCIVLCTLACLHTGVLTGTCTQQVPRPCTQRQAHLPLTWSHPALSLWGGPHCPIPHPGHLQGGPVPASPQVCAPTWWPSEEPDVTQTKNRRRQWVWVWAADDWREGWGTELRVWGIKRLGSIGRSQDLNSSLQDCPTPMLLGPFVRPGSIRRLHSGKTCESLLALGQ